MKIQFKSCMLTAAAALALTCTAPVLADYVKPDIHHAPYEEFKVVVPITSAEFSVWKFRLHNVINGARVATESGGVMHAKVVLYGGAVKMLTKPMEPELGSLLADARAAGVQILVCNFTLKGMNQDWHELGGVAESDIVPSGFAEVGWLASHGWAVDSAN